MNADRTRFASSARRGFTLLEILLVLVLLALLATLTTASLATSFRAATLRSVIDQIIAADAQSRALARNSDRAITLAIYATGHTITRDDSTIAAIPSAIAIDEVLIAGSSAIRIDSQGRSPTYAVRLHAPRSKATWLLITGPTAIPYETQNDSEIREIFARLADGRDAH